MSDPRQPNLDVIERPQEKTKTKKPPMYHVIMLNDDYTTMEFVAFVLMRVFHKEPHEAEKITFEIHIEGKGLCGTYSHEVAEMKVGEVLGLARREEFPLQCTVEQAE
jgi:ATP-dependent Clp protease adaptor protein ClpS